MRSQGVSSLGCWRGLALSCIVAVGLVTIVGSGGGFGAAAWLKPAGSASRSARAKINFTKANLPPPSKRRRAAELFNELGNVFKRHFDTGTGLRHREINSDRFRAAEL